MRHNICMTELMREAYNVGFSGPEGNLISLNLAKHTREIAPAFLVGLFFHRAVKSFMRNASHSFSTELQPSSPLSLGTLAAIFHRCARSLGCCFAYMLGAACWCKVGARKVYESDYAFLSNLCSLSICQKQPTSFAKLIIHEQTTAVEICMPVVPIS